MLSKYLLNRCNEQLSDPLSSERGLSQPQGDQSPFVLAEIRVTGLLEEYGSSDARVSYLSWDTALPSSHIFCLDSELILSGCGQVGDTDDCLPIVSTFLRGSLHTCSHVKCH